MKKTDEITAFIILYSKGHYPTSGSPLLDIGLGLEKICSLPAGFYRKNLFRVFLTLAPIFEDFKDISAGDFWKTMFYDPNNFYELRAVDFHNVASKMIGCLGTIRVMQHDKVLIDLPKEPNPLIVKYMNDRHLEEEKVMFDILVKNTNLH
jgi:hypothetical protein